MVDVVMLARDHGADCVTLAVRCAFAGGAHDGRGVAMLALGPVRTNRSTCAAHSDAGGLGRWRQCLSLTNDPQGQPTRPLQL